jgi:unsaturated rhamnogalacturonyl hydrolase
MYSNKALENYIEKLLEESTTERPVWNVESSRGEIKPGWNYIDGVMIKALLDYGRISGNTRCTAFAKDFIGSRVAPDGTVAGYKREKYNLDDINAGKTLFTLLSLTGEEKYRKALDFIYRQIKEQPRTFEGNFWHKRIYPEQVWLDGFYMVMPFYMQYETAFNNRENYTDIFRQFKNARRRMKDSETGLYYHGYDASRSIFWCDPQTGLSANFWTRSIGWFLMALLDTVEQCDKTGFEKEYAMLCDMFRELTEAMLKYRSGNNFWYQVPDKGGTEPNYEETSGTAIMAYSLLKGARLGLLPEKCRDIGREVFESICRRYIDDDGNMTLGGICLVAGLGPDSNRRRDGSFEYYMSEPVVENDAKGVGPFLLAYTEMLRI